MGQRKLKAAAKVVRDALAADDELRAGHRETMTVAATRVRRMWEPGHIAGDGSAHMTGKSERRRLRDVLLRGAK